MVWGLWSAGHIDLALFRNFEVIGKIVIKKKIKYNLHNGLIRIFF
jgi:hypothetical protein